MHTVSLQPLYDLINTGLADFFQGLAAFVVGWIMYALAKYAPPSLRAYIEGKAATELRVALANGVAIAMHNIEGAEQLHQNIQVKNLIVAYAARWALTQVPGAVKRFGFTPEDLALRALAYLPAPPVTADLTGAKGLAPAPVAVASLSPVT